MFISGSNNSSYENYQNIIQNDSGEVEYVVQEQRGDLFTQESSKIEAIPEVTEVFNIPSQNQESRDTSSPLSFLDGLDSAQGKEIVDKLNNLTQNEENSLSDEMREIRTNNDYMSMEERGDKFLQILQESYGKEFSIVKDAPSNNNSTLHKDIETKLELKEAVNNKTYDFLSKAIGINIYG